MKDNLSANELVIDYCAFMVAIVLVRHVVDMANINDQWTAETLSTSLNLLPHSESVNFRVCVALKHGMHLFSR